MSDLTRLTYQKRDYALAIFLIASITLHVGALFVAAYLVPVEPPIEAESVELEIEGAPDEPPSLGTNDEETGPPPEPEEAPTPPPVPEDTPPPPPVPSDFDVPEEKPTPAPTPKPAAPKPQVTPAKTPGPATAPKVNPNARPGAVKGVDASRGGVAGGTGAYKSSGSGGKADFSATPNMTIPYNLRQRLSGFKGSAAALISYSNGSITSVAITRSSGSAPLDAAIVRHVKGNYRVKAGRTGKANLPIGIKL
ncbi:MAG TPA: hypothetical protein VIT21_02060 [Chthoniobacterales bacterium]